MPTLILTLALEPASQAFFERMRQLHYPAALNKIPAHLTLFHQLPLSATHAVHRAAHQGPFQLQVTGLRSLGRGVAYTVACEPLLKLHAHLAHTFAADLIPQDRQRFSPHIVIRTRPHPKPPAHSSPTSSATSSPSKCTPPHWSSGSIWTAPGRCSSSSPSASRKP